MPPKRKAADEGGGSDDASEQKKTRATGTAETKKSTASKKAGKSKEKATRTAGKKVRSATSSSSSEDSGDDASGGSGTSASAAIPKRNKQGQLVFPDYPKFRPNLTPKEVLQMGSFGGTYFRPIKSSVTGKTYRDVWKEFPEDWFEGLNVKKQVANPTYSTSLNKYRVSCGGDLEMWESSGWMRECDPYGWFQWYCRFYLGRRCDDDERQISRGLKVFGPTGRWRTQLCNRILAKDTSVDDASISPKIRQLIQHWAYKITDADLKAHAKKKKG